jgi:hypothetical protein
MPSEYKGPNPYARDKRVIHTLNASSGEEFTPIKISDETFTILLELQRTQLPGDVTIADLPQEILNTVKTLVNATNIIISDGRDTDEYLVLSYDTRSGRSMSICLYGS